MCIYVATDGKDENPGTIDRPVASLEAARDIVRARRASEGQAFAGATVNLRAGTWRRAKTFELEARDSGTTAGAVVYRAQPGESVRLIGGVELAGDLLEPVTDPTILARIIDEEARRKVLQLDLKAVGITDYGAMKHRGFSRPYANAPMELFFNNRPMTLSHWPSDGFVKITKVLDSGSKPRNGDFSERGGRFVYDSARPNQWKHAEDIWVHGMFGTVWADDTLRVASIDFDKKEITTEKPHLYGITGGHFQALNLLEEISQPGEYYVNREAGMLYFWPPADPVGATLGLSMLEEPMVALEGASHVTFEGLTFEITRGIGVYIEGGTGVRVAGCALRNMGVVAVAIGRGIKPFDHLSHEGIGEPASRELGNLRQHLYADVTWNQEAGTNHGVVSCDIHDIGAGGVSLGGGDRRTLAPAGNHVVNCRIFRVNRLDKTYRPSIDLNGVGNRIAHNIMYDATHSAVIFYGNDHRMEYNVIHDVLLESDDGGAFYTGRDVTTYGNVIRHNHVYNVGSTNPLYHHGYWHGVYLDDHPGGITVSGNVFRNIKAGVLASGRDVKVLNNVLVDCGRPIVVQIRPVSKIHKDRLLSLPVRELPWCTRFPSLAGALDNHWGEFVGTEVRNNVHSGESDCVSVDRVNADFLTIRDNLSLREDPGFTDPENGDFSLREDSVVYRERVEFDPIPFDRIGLIDDAYRRMLPPLPKEPKGAEW